jgi:hypothetical protein
VPHAKEYEVRVLDRRAAREAVWGLTGPETAMRYSRRLKEPLVRNSSLSI